MAHVNTMHRVYISTWLRMPTHAVLRGVTPQTCIVCGTPFEQPVPHSSHATPPYPGTCSGSCSYHLREHGLIIEQAVA